MTSIGRGSDGFHALANLLRRRARDESTAGAFRFLPDGGEQEAETWSFRRLDRRARAVAARIQAAGLAGKPVMLLLPPGLSFVGAFFGCLYAGAVAVPIAPPGLSRLARTLPRIQRIVADAGATLALASESMIHALQELLPRFPSAMDTHWVAADTIGEDESDSWCEHEPAGEDVALLQYTSGSTASPKGVMVTHANLTANLSAIHARLGLGREDTSVSWLPPYHDMGLIGGILIPVFSGSFAVLMPPMAFLRQPLRWLATASRYRARIIGGPNFALDLCLQRVREDQLAELALDDVEIVYTGAEPVRWSTINRFVERFAACGLRREMLWPCYGLAECTLFVTGGDRRSEPRVLALNKQAFAKGRVAGEQREDGAGHRLVSCGRPGDGDRVVIVDPETGRACRNDVIGEIWISGPSVAKGYWNQPEATSETFQSRLAGSDDGPFLRTGDLGFLYDGELYVGGRIKDVLIIRGRNHHPQDVEHTVAQSHPSLVVNGGAAFAVEVDERESLVIVQECRRGDGWDGEAVVSAIRRAVIEEHEIDAHAIILIRRHSLPKTTSGKVQRRACRQQFLEGGLRELYRWQATAPGEQASSRATVTDRPQGEHQWRELLRRRLAERLAVDAERIDVRQPLSQYGLDSKEAVVLAGELEDISAKKLPATLAYDYPTIADLAAFLAGRETAPEPGAATAPSRSEEPVAVIAMACRFPAAASPEAFAELLRSSGDAIREVPAERWPVDELYDADPDAPGRMSSRWGGFIDDVAGFDATLFGIAPREAAEMDPQQRVLLEVVWEALERAGQAPDRLTGSRTGVFIGMSTSDYYHLRVASGLPLNTYVSTGNALSIAANRLSYLLGLQGPSLAIDTACSSSLVAVHLACQSLRRSESDLALAGGVNLMLSPQGTILFSKAHLMASDGRCKTFSSAADGYVRSEGCGVVVLKRLPDALANRDPILAVLSGSAVNQDGHSNGLTAPSKQAQSAVLRAAIADAGLQPADIDYVEAHGTGTALGDPIEVAALTEVFGGGRAVDRPLVLSSVKTNVGHLEAAAGIAGLCKVVIALQESYVPAHLHLHEINGRIDLEAIPAVVPTTARPWTGDHHIRRAGVSSFGFGGTNAHVVVEEAPGREQPAAGDERPLHLLTLSGHSDEQLRETARRYCDDALRQDAASVPDICFTANTGRAQLPYRLAVLRGTGRELAADLRAYAQGEAVGITGRAEVDADRVAFMFAGQGCQYPGMGRQLYETQPTFREHWNRSAAILDAELDLSLNELVLGGNGDCQRLDHTRYTQPALFAVEYALAKLWESWGLRPAALVGHSVGEYVAACLAGVFSLRDAIRLVAARSRLIAALPEGGGMAAVFASQRRVSELVRQSGAAVDLAAVNAPEQVVLSGLLPELEQVIAALHEQDVGARLLPVSHAFHSRLLEPMLDEFAAVARTVAYAAPACDVVSNLSGEVASGTDVSTPDYWVEHVRAPVRFLEGVTTLSQLGVRSFLEIGPGTVLCGLGAACVEDPRLLWVSSLDKKQEDWQRLLESLGRLWTRGVAVDWPAFDHDYARRRVLLPTYPFARKQLWFTDRPAEWVESAIPEQARRPAPSATPVAARVELHGLDPQQRDLMLHRLVHQAVTSVLRLDEAAELDEDRSLIAVGLDSLMFVELHNRLRAACGVSLPATVFVAEPSIRTLAKLIADGLAEAPATSGGSDELPVLVPDAGHHHDPFPLTDVQYAYWIGRSRGLLLGGVSCYNYLEVELVDLDLERLNVALNQLIRRHDMLRAVIHSDGRQQVLPEIDEYVVAVEDLSGVGAALRRERLQAKRDAMAQQVLPVDRAPLFDIRASRLDDHRVRLHIGFDLLISDAWSFTILIRDWAALYRNPLEALPALELAFRDYVVHEHRLRQTAAYEQDRAYWRQRLADLPAGPDLPLARQPESVTTPRFVRRSAGLEPAQWRRLKERAGKAGLTPSGLLLAAFAEVLASWSKSPRFTLTLTLFHRLPLHRQVNAIVGDFTSLVLLAVERSPGRSFADHARQVQAQLWQDLEHPLVSGVEVVRELARNRKGDQLAIAPVVFTSALPLAAGDDGRPLRLPDDLSAELVYAISQTPQVWLDHQVLEYEGALHYSWDAVDELFPAGMLDHVFAAYGRLLDRLVSDDQLWRDGAIVHAPASQLAVRSGCNATRAPISELCLHHLFLDQAERRRDQPAIVTAGRRVSYGELDELSRGLAHLLRRRGARPNSLVAVIMDKGWEQVVATLAVCRAGAAYLPVDPALPARRIEHLLRDGEVKLALTQSWVAERRLIPSEVKLLAVDTLAAADRLPDGGLDDVAGADELAYVIYTSGSTGQPKGVMIDHRAAVNTILEVNRRFAVTAEDRVLGVSNLSFDLSVYDVFGLLAAGGGVVLGAADRTKDPADWCAMMRQARVTVWNSTPALMQMLLEYVDGRSEMLPPWLRLVLLSGDWVPLAMPGRLRELYPEIRVVALGGATEAAIWSNYHQVDAVDPTWTSIPYGRPLANQRYHVLDDSLRPCPDWVPGQLHIAGAGLARGYWNDAEKTAAGFITHPESGERLYRTGDLGRYQPDGIIEFLGREDAQVKISGYRIELGEIEAAMQGCAGVREAAVAVVGDPGGERRLVGYVVGGDPQERTAAAGDDALLAEAMQAEGITLVDELDRLQFKLRRPSLRTDLDGCIRVGLAPPGAEEREVLARYSQRLSYRRFRSEPIPQHRLAGWLEELMTLDLPQWPVPRHRYGSAGWTYAVQSYLLIKPGRVEGIDGGAYYYHPGRHELVRLADTVGEQQGLFPPGNAEIYEQAAFALFLVADMEAVAPLYGKRSDEFVLIEAGLITQLLETAAFAKRIGVCQIGAVDFPRLRPLFRLQERHHYLHCLVGGAIAQHEGWSFLDGLDDSMPDSRPAADSEQAFVETVKAHLREWLPAHMVPSTILRLAALPLTDNGKVDRQALPLPGQGERSGARPVAPRNREEELIAGIVSEVLGRPRIGVLDNFFDLGASSLHLVQCQRRLSDVLQREVAITELFEHPNVSVLARHLQGHDRDHEAASTADQRIRERRIRRAREQQRRRSRPVEETAVAGTTK